MGNLAEGHILAERYHIDRLLDSGFWGELWLSHDSEMERPVAIKALKRDPRFLLEAAELRPEERHEIERAHTRFVQEARTAGKLRHPNIVVVYDLLEDGSYIAMEFLPGGSLEDRILAAVRAGSKGLDDAVPILRGICRGLAAVHARGILHRDLKPDNIVFDEWGTPKIVDFGEAHIANLGDDYVRVGSRYYAAPEKVLGRRIDGRSDLYSLGAIAYKMLTGRFYLDPEVVDLGSSSIESAILDVMPLPIRRLNADVPKALERVVLRLLAKNPEDRFALAQHVVEALEGKGQEDELDEAPFSPPSNEEIIRRARELLAAQEPDGALEVLRNGLERNPDSADLQLELAKSYLKLREAVEAKEWYSRLVDCWPDHVEARCGLATCQSRLGDLAGALLTYKEGLLSAAHESAYLIGAGMALYHLRRYLEAIPYLRRALLSHENPAVRRTLVECERRRAG